MLAPVPASLVCPAPERGDMESSHGGRGRRAASIASAVAAPAIGYYMLASLALSAGACDHYFPPHEAEDSGASSADASAEGDAGSIPADAGVEDDAARTGCALGTYDGDGDPETTCVAWRICSPGQYTSWPGNEVSDRECARCPTGTYSSEPNAAACRPWSTCSPGSYVSNSPDEDLDRTCAPCSAGSYADSKNATSCRAFTACLAGQYVAVEGNAGRDRLCEVCPAGSFSVSVNAPVCEPKRDCRPGEYLAAAETSTGDRQCAACMAGTYSAVSNAAECLPYTTCPVGTFAPGTPSTDTVCAPAVTALATGYDHTCALRADGTVSCWG
jgi:hypothetical protein